MAGPSRTRCRPSVPHTRAAGLLPQAHGGGWYSGECVRWQYTGPSCLQLQQSNDCWVWPKFAFGFVLNGVMALRLQAKVTKFAPFPHGFKLQLKWLDRKSVIPLSHPAPIDVLPAVSLHPPHRTSSLTKYCPMCFWSCAVARPRYSHYRQRSKVQSHTGPSSGYCRSGANSTSR